jgi:ubiquinone/menaquinone biosynthesis C-methylase UbiE
MTQKENHPQYGSLITTPERGLTFEDFANQPEYIEVNRGLVRRLFSLLPENFLHVDVATGTGLIPKLLAEEAQKVWNKGQIIGVDPNSISLDIAKRTTHGIGNILVKFIEGKGQDLRTLLDGEIPEEGVDGVSIHDAIHEIPGEDAKRSVIRSMTEILKNGGLFSYNSAFTNIAMTDSPMDWGKWKMAAFRLLKGTRDKEIEPIKIHTPEEYRKMLQETGLVIVHEARNVVNLTRSALEAISRYPEFAEGVFRDMKDTLNVSLGDKSQTLISALGKLNIISMKRTWHEIIAQKPALI